MSSVTTSMSKACACNSICRDTFKAFIAWIYTWCEGICLAFQWYFCGFDFEDHFQKACEELSSDTEISLKKDEPDRKLLRAKPRDLTEEEKNELRNYKHFRANFGKTKDSDGAVLVSVNRPMPFGMGYLSPVFKASDWTYDTLVSIYAPNMCGQTPPLKYRLSYENMINPLQVAEIMLHSEIVVPHTLLCESFPFNLFKGLYEYFYYEVAKSLQEVIYAMEDVLLIEKYGNAINVDIPDDAQCKWIMSNRLESLRKTKGIYST